MVFRLHCANYNNVQHISVKNVLTTLFIKNAVISIHDNISFYWKVCRLIDNMLAWLNGIVSKFIRANIAHIYIPKGATLLFITLGSTFSMLLV